MWLHCHNVDAYCTPSFRLSLCVLATVLFCRDSHVPKQLKAALQPQNTCICLALPRRFRTTASRFRELEPRSTTAGSAAENLETCRRVNYNSALLPSRATVAVMRSVRRCKVVSDARPSQSKMGPTHAPYACGARLRHATSRSLWQYGRCSLESRRPSHVLQVACDTERIS